MSNDPQTVSTGEGDAAARVERVLVGKSGGKLHIPEDGRPRCATDGSLREKPLSVFPPAHRDWCRACLGLYDGE